MHGIKKNAFVENLALTAQFGLKILSAKITVSNFGKKNGMAA